MNLNFVDPPIGPDLDPFTLSITADLVPEAVQGVAEWIEGPEICELWGSPDLPIRQASAIRADDVASTYVEALPFVARFLTVELDSQTPGNNGIGRVMDGDPPPRFGGKFRKQLRQPEIRREAGRVIEKFILDGFLGNAIASMVFYSETRIPGSSESIEQMYRQWVRDFAPTWWEVIPTVDPNESLIGFLFGSTAMPTIMEYRTLCERHRIGTSFGKRKRKETYANYFFAVGWCLYHVFSHPGPTVK